MTAAVLIGQFRARGVRLSARDGQVLIDAPRGTLGLTDLDLLRNRKPDLLACLAENVAEVENPSPDDNPIEDGPIEVPANGWRWILATWKPLRWRAWHARACDLATPGSSAEATLLAQYVAFLELSSHAEELGADHDSARLLAALASLAPAVEAAPVAQESVRRVG